MFDEVKEISWGDVIKLFSTFGQSFIQFDDCGVDSDNGMNENLMPGFILLDFNFERFHNRVDDNGEFFSNLNQTFFRPISEPINNTTIEQSR